MTDDYVAARITREVDRLFEVDRKKYRGRLRQTPILGGSYVPGKDNIRPLKKLARAALLAREWFDMHGAAIALPLPLSMGDRHDLERGGVLHILAWYARSFECRDYHV